MGAVKKVGEGELDLVVSAGWGHVGKEGVTMPGKGRIVQRPYDKTEAAGIDAAAKVLLGPDTRDVYLNDKAYWKNVPANVWEYTIGGYQVIKKWLSYREKPLLGRGLTAVEVRYVTEMARRLAALVAMRPALDANYKTVAGETFDLGATKQGSPASGIDR